MAETKKINATVDLVKSGVEFKLNGGTILSDDGTSHYLHSQSNLYLYSGSSNTMVLTNSGNVGIGTTSPTYKFEVSNGTQTGTFNPNSSGFMFLGSTSNHPLYFGVNDSTKVAILSSGNVGIGTTSPSGSLHVYKSAGQANVIVDAGGNNAYFFANNGANWGLWGFQAQPFTLATNSSERFRITADGNVGIGTTSPQTKLHIEGLTRITEGGNTAFYSGNYVRLFNSQAFQFRDSGGSTTAQINLNGNSYFNGGNVGIGTTSPDSLLQIGESYTTTSGTNKKIIANIGGYYSTATGFQYQALGFTGTTFDESDISGQTSGEVLKNFYIGLFADAGYFNGNRFSIYQGGAERLSVNQSGNVGIGTTSPAAQLHVSSASSSATSVYVGNTGTGVSRAYFDASNGDFAGSDYMWIGQNNDLSGEIVMTQSAGAFHIKTQPGGTVTSRLTVLQDGNVGIGTTSPSYKLSVNGDIQIPQNEYIYFDNTAHYIRRGSSDVEIQGFNGLQLRTNGSTRLYINQSGNVGIGTTTISGQEGTANGTPKLQVLKTGTTGSYDLVARFGTDQDENNSGASVLINAGNDRGLLVSAGRADSNRAIAHLNLIQYDGNELTDGLTIYQPDSGSAGATSGTNVGIGTTSPDTKLHIYESAAAPVLLTLNNYQSDINPNGTQGNFIDFKMTDDNATFTPQVRIGMIVKDSDGDSGLMSEGCGNFVVYTGEGTDQAGNGTLTEHFRITDKGKVGIGTTSPGAKLDVSGGSLKVQSGDTFGYDSSHAAIYMDALGRGLSGKFGGNGYARNLIKSDGSSTVHIGDNTSLISRILLDAGSSGVAGYISLQTKQAERVRIDADGNVGIGTTSPTLLTSGVGSLSLGGTNSTTSGGLFYQVNGTYKAYSFVSNNAYIHRGQDNVYQSFWTDATEKMRIDTSGNVGIGTTAPTWKFVVSNSGGIGFEVDPDDGLAGKVGLYAYNRSSSAYVPMRLEASSFDFNNSIGIGTASPDAKLTIISGAKGIHVDKGSHSSSSVNIAECRTNYAFAYDTLRNGSTTGFFITNVNSNTPAIQVGDSSNNAQPFSIQPFGGNVGIGTTSPAYNLDVNGNINATGFYIGGINQIAGTEYIAPLARTGTWTRDAGTSPSDEWVKVISYNGGPRRIRLWLNHGGDNTNMYDEYLISHSSYGMQTHIYRLPGSKYNTSKVLGIKVINSSGAVQDVWVKLAGIASGSGSFVYRSNVTVESSTNVAASATATEPSGTTGSSVLYISDSNRNEFTTMSSGGGYFGGNISIGTASPTANLHITSSGTPIKMSRSGYDDYGFVQSAGTGLQIQNFTDNRTEMFFDGGGNIGMGTTSPKSQLHIYKSNTGGIGGELRLDNNGLAVANKTRILFSDAGGNSASFDRAAIVVETENSPYNGQFQFQTGFGTLTTKMIISGAGNVGIGTTSPQSKLHVQSGAGIFNVSDDWQQSTYRTHLFRGGGFNSSISEESTAVKIFNGSAGTGKSAGKYWGGIGFMHLDPEFSSWGTTYTGEHFWIGGRLIDTPSQERSALVFATNNVTTAGSHSSEKMVILPNGNVGIGTTSPGYNLTVDNDALNTNNAALYVRNPNSSSGAVIAEFVGDSDAIQIKNINVGDYVIYNTQQSNGIALYDGTGGVEIHYAGVAVLEADSTGGIKVTGQLSATGDVVAYSSDERLKENIKPIENAVDKIKQLKGVTFDWNEKSQELGFEPSTKTNDVGVIAQDVEAVFPQLVHLAPFDIGSDEEGKATSKTGEDYKTVNYARLTAVLIEAVKEQQQQIDELKEIINGLTK